MTGPKSVSETRVQIADEPGGQTPDSGTSPYQNLWVPLVLVPAGIVMAIVVIVALFGNLAGDERSPLENLELIASGGKNERQQALMALAVQASENQSARNKEEELPHPYPDNFLPRAMEVAADLDTDDYWTRFALGAFLAGAEESAAAVEQGVNELRALLKDPEIPDGDVGRIHMQVLINLGLLAQGPDQPADAALEDLLPFLDHDDPVMRSTAASILTHVDGARGPLEGALTDSDLSVRAAAAFSLAKLNPPAYSCASVLRSLTAMETYDQARAADRTQFTKGEGISRLRRRALECLALLDRDEDWNHISSLSEDDDSLVAEKVLNLLNSREEGQG